MSPVFVTKTVTNSFGVHCVVEHTEQRFFLTKEDCLFVTECPKIYRKSVLYLLKYTANLYSSKLRLDIHKRILFCIKQWCTLHTHTHKT